MTDWENLRHFAALAQAGTLSGAARLLNVEHATIARRITALEAELKLKLVDRRGRKLCLTAEGERIASMVERMGWEAVAINRAAEGARSELTGDVTISAPPALAAAILGRPIVAVRKQHPGIRICILGETRHASLEKREADIAIRLSRPVKGDFIIVKLTEITLRLYGSSAYLNQTQHDDWAFIGYIENMDAASQQVALMQKMKDRSFSIRASTLEMQHALVREGGGVAMLPDFIAENDSTLIAAASDQPSVTREVWLVFHTDMKDSGVIRAVVNSIRKSFRE